MKKNILIFGNSLVAEDSLAINLMPKLQNQFPELNFISLDPTENIQEYGKDLKIIDVVQGIKEPIIITDINKLKTGKITSMHDFDLAYNLKLLMQTGKINSVKILGLPLEMNEDKAFNYCQSILRKWVAQDMQGS
jgi:Ni,Fe-hydrogenase maturation factor